MNEVKKYIDGMYQYGALNEMVCVGDKIYYIRSLKDFEELLNEQMGYDAKCCFDIILKQIIENCCE